MCKQKERTKHDYSSPPSSTFLKIDELSILEFKLSLSLEILNNIFDDKDVNMLFNSFLNTYLGLFDASFPLKLPKSRSNSRERINSTIKT
jgi:hypothetical protein